MRDAASAGNTTLLGRRQAQQGVVKKWKSWFILVVFVFRLESNSWMFKLGSFDERSAWKR